MAKSGGVHHIHNKTELHKCLASCKAECEKKHKKKAFFITRSQFDKMMIIVAVLYPLTMVPQILKIFATQDASSVSTLTFGVSIFFAIPWFIYGLWHKVVPLICSNILWVLGYLIIVIQTVVY